MSSYIKKIKSKPIASTLRANHLLTIILLADDLLTMYLYSTYIVRGFESYKVSKIDSSRYTEYIRTKCPNYDILGVSPT
jgi:hypothetical protein